MDRRQFLSLPLAAVGGPALAIRVSEIRPGIFVVEHSYPWPSNSVLLAMPSGEVLVLDTPYTDAATVELLDWVRERFHRKPRLAINTHYHIDRLGGNQALIDAGIPVHGSDHTARLVAEKGWATHQRFVDMIQEPAIREHYRQLKLVPPNRVFREKDGLKLRLGKNHIEVFWPGAGHSPDNLVVWWPERRFLFASCTMLASPKLGNMAEADVKSWLGAIDLLERLQPEVVIPGHGGADCGYSPALIEHTRKLLSAEAAR